MNTEKQVEFQISGHTIRLKLDTCAYSQKAIYDTCQDGWLYESLTVITLSKFLQPGDVFVDCGAHVGYYSLIAAAMVGESGKVLAFEPNPTNFQCFNEEVRLNNFRNIIQLQYAVGDKVSVVPLYQNAHNDGGHTLWAFSNVPGVSNVCGPDRPIEVQEVTLDVILRKLNLNKIKAIKFDVEGAEVIAIRGAVETLTKRGVELLIVEIHALALEAMGNSVPELLRILTELGFCGFTILDAEHYTSIEFDSSFNPTGKWWDHHKLCIENIFFIHESSPMLASLVPTPSWQYQR